MKTYEELEQENRKLREEKEALEKSLNHFKNEIEKVFRNRLNGTRKEINEVIKIVDNLIEKVERMQFPLPPKRE